MKTMKKQLIYWLDKYQSNNLEELCEINSLLCNHGISIEVKQYENGKGILIKYDTEQIKEKLHRNAGRNKKQCLLDVEVKDIRERMNKGESAEMIASELGISRSTLFRKLKYAKEHDIMFLQ